MKKLEKLAEGIKFFGVMSLYLAGGVIIGAGNEIYQQAKHLGYHIRDVSHKRENAPSDSSFFYYRKA